MTESARRREWIPDGSMAAGFLPEQSTGSRYAPMMMTHQEIADEMTRRGYPMGGSAVRDTLTRALRKMAEAMPHELDQPDRISPHRRNGKQNVRTVQ